MKKIAVIRLDGPCWVRFALAEDNHFWTGSMWSSELRDARLYADEQAVADAYHELLTGAAGQPVRVFEATVRVQVIGGELVDPGQLQDHLKRASHFYLDAVADAGPLSEVTILGAIEWAGLRELH